MPADVSGEHIVSIFRVEKQTEPETAEMKYICSSETSVDSQRTARRYIPKDNAIHNHRSENLKSYIVLGCASRISPGAPSDLTDGVPEFTPILLVKFVDKGKVKLSLCLTN
jgi:hypothetical protein